MTDCFALLDLPRQPWLDPELVQERFTALSARFHPDKLASPSQEEQARAISRFAELNHAYQTLRETKSRLGHLIQLESGTAPGSIEEVSGESAALFFEVSNLCRQADQFLDAAAGATSPLLKAKRFAQALEWTDRLQALQQGLQENRSGLEEKARQLNDAWLPGKSPSQPRSDAIDQLKEIYSKLGFITRWNAQIQNRIVALAV